MIEAKATDARCVQYEFEVPIAATRERVWTAIFEEINCWWLPDFHMTGKGSIVTFDPTPGGEGLVERVDGAGELQWYQVQFYQPVEFKVYLVGFLAPDWGGPSTSHLKLALEKSKVDPDNACVLKVSDAHQGKMDLKSVQSLGDGWLQLFTDGLKAFVEDGTRQDG